MENDWEVAENVAGARVRELRQARGWSQEQLGKAMAEYGFPLTQTTVAKLERGARPLRLNEMWALAAIFGVGVTDVMGQTPRQSTASANFQADRREKVSRQLAEQVNRLAAARARLEEAEEERAEAAARAAQLQDLVSSLEAEVRVAREYLERSHGG